MKNFVFLIFITLSLASCGKVGPLSLPENKLDKSKNETQKIINEADYCSVC